MKGLDLYSNLARKHIEYMLHWNQSSLAFYYFIALRIYVYSGWKDRTKGTKDEQEMAMEFPGPGASNWCM